MKTKDAKAATPAAAAAPFDDFPIAKANPPATTVATDDIMSFDVNEDYFFFGGKISRGFSLTQD